MDGSVVRHSERGTPLSTLLEGGFRPFFLLAGAYGALSLLGWLLAYTGHWSVPAGWVPMWWHGHELLYGFALAAVCGFLLTAVPKWTSTPPVTGARLGGLVGLWLAGRAAMWAAGVLPAWVVAVADLALIPALGWAVGMPIVRRGSPRNYGFPPVIAGLFAANLASHLPALGLAPALTARTGLMGATYLVVVLIAVISGRIVPAFTGGALRERGGPEVRNRPLLGRTAVGAVVLASATQLLTAHPWAQALPAAAAAVLLAARATGWRSMHTARQPMLWILHVGHAWLIVGFALLAAAALTDVVPSSSALHAFTAGAMGTMVLAVMTRAALGHTGRRLVASPAMTTAYVLVVLGGLARVVASLLPAQVYVPAVVLAGILWMGAYGLFTVVYLPILLRPRVDG
jgi:uncharacterized protein involved in response to NO